MSLDFTETFDIAFLKKCGKLPTIGYFGGYSGTCAWLDDRGEKVATTDFKVTFSDIEAKVILEYSYHERAITYPINLMWTNSNLGKGAQWFFLCPETRRLCRKLYWYRGYFRSRPALLRSGVYYSAQKRSSKHRGGLWGFFDVHDKRIEFIEYFQKPYAKKFYRDCPTRKAQRAVAFLWQTAWVDEWMKSEVGKLNVG